MKKVSIQEKFQRFSDHWAPKIIGELNGQHLKLAKVSGEFVWHDHSEEDELFWVHKGTLFLDLRDGTTIELHPGEFYIVPRGVEHRPRTKAGEEVWIMLIEPIGIKHTGEVRAEVTVEEYTWI